MEKVRQLKQDHGRNRCEIELCDGRRMAFNVHLFTASELRTFFASRFDIEDLRGLDLFHSRFSPDPRWNPARSRVDGPFSDELVRLEEEYATRREFMDRAVHLLLVARSRAAKSRASTVDQSPRIRA
jgi:hypothetical protein